MARVFLARDLKLSRSVAIKVLRPEVAAALGAERFLREIEIAARLNHPHILPVHDSGEALGLLYYVMPYVEGQSLRDRLTRERQLPLDTALHIALQVASALSYAHSHDVVHRDIKPENILLVGEDVVVADFGIARAITEAAGDRLTSTGISVGTPAYMSPEQGAGEPHLDGRSDLFSLGCVLYEMLAGTLPFLGATAQAIQARRLADPVPPLRTLRGTVPARVERAIGTALAKVPADRFATAHAFSEALSGEDIVAASPTRRRWVAWAIGGVSVAAMATLVRALLVGSGGTVQFAENLVAVAPFDTHGVSVGTWGEGLVEYLSRSLDGAGDVRTVSPSVFLRRWSGRADLASARALGRRTGAGLVVFGSVVQGGRDSVRLRATLLDMTRDRVLGEVEVGGDTLAIDRVADSLAVALLRELGHTRPVGAIRNAPFGTALLPALKSFLQGERFYRRSLYDSALAHHARAVTLDTSFALAYRRLSQEVGWNPSTSGAYQSPEIYSFRAAALNHGLGVRDSLLIVADSMFSVLAHGDPSQVAFDPLLRRLYGVLEEAARRFPGELEVWQALGETYQHLDPQEILTVTLRAFDRAIALDSGFTPAYEHVLRPAVAIGGAKLARPYARAILSLGVMDASNRLAAVLLDPDRSQSPEVTQFIDTAPVHTLFRAGIEHLGFWADSAETAIRLVRAMSAGHRSVAGTEGFVADTAMWPQYLARALLYRGHTREAYDVYRRVLAHPPNPRWAWFLDPFVELATLNVAPAETVRAAIARAPASGALSWRRWLPWWYAQRDTAALSRAIFTADSVARHAKSALDQARARSWRSVAVGYVALLQGDSAAALRDLRSVAEPWCACPREQLVLAQLLESRGEAREAAEIIDRLLWSSPTPTFVFARLERARIAEAAGDRELAAQWYQFVADVWRAADPELQPFVTEARAGMRRLGHEQ